MRYHYGCSMSVRKFGQADQIEAWSKKLGEIMDEMVRRTYVQFRDAGHWQPATNVYETAGMFFVCVAVAGMSREDIDVQCIDDRRISVSGQRGMPRHADMPQAADAARSVESSPPAGVARQVGLPDDVCIHLSEIDEGPFRRIIELSERVDTSRVEALYDKGFLWVALPKTTPRT